LTRRRNNCWRGLHRQLAVRDCCSRPNKSLDASGGSVFRIMTGPAMLE
jgi:hypothetical protein